MKKIKETSNKFSGFFYFKISYFLIIGILLESILYLIFPIPHTGFHISVGRISQLIFFILLVLEKKQLNFQISPYFNFFYFRQYCLVSSVFRLRIHFKQGNFFKFKTSTISICFRIFYFTLLLFYFRCMCQSFPR